MMRLLTPQELSLESLVKMLAGSAFLFAEHPAMDLPTRTRRIDHIEEYRDEALRRLRGELAHGSADGAGACVDDDEEFVKRFAHDWNYPNDAENPALMRVYRDCSRRHAGSPRVCFAGGDRRVIDVMGGRS